MNGADRTPLRRWLDENGWSLERLSQEAGISLRTAFSASQGEWISGRTIDALRTVTGLPADDLIPPRDTDGDAA